MSSRSLILGYAPVSLRIHIITRFGQALLGIPYTILILYAYFHSGWWLNLKLPMECGAAAITLTFLHTGLFIVRLAPLISRQQMHGNQAGTIFPRSHSRHLCGAYFFTLVDICLSGVWIATAVTMCLSKGKDFRLMFARPPYGTWVAAIVLAVVQSLTFVWSAIMMLRERPAPRMRLGENRVRAVELDEGPAAGPYARM